MKHNHFEEFVYGAVSNDYEAPHTITSDIARELGHPYTEKEVRSALIALARAGKVQAYIYDHKKSRYIPISSIAAENEQEAWFMAIKRSASEGI
jgi:predicted transcriptional regulator